MRYYIEEKARPFEDKTSILGQTGEPIFHIWGESFSIVSRLHICDLEDRELYCVERKIFAFMSEYHIFHNGGLCATIRGERARAKPKLSIESSLGSYTINGNVLNKDYYMFKNMLYIGEIHKKLLSFGACEELTVDEAANQALFCALVIAVDDCMNDER